MAHRKNQLKKAILRLMESPSYRPASYIFIHRFLPGFKKSKVKKALEALEDEGKVAQVKRGCYQLVKKLRVKKGHFEANPRQFGFVVTENEDVFIPPFGVQGAMQGDLVLVSIRQAKGRSREGVIVKVLERKHKRLVAEVEKVAQKVIAIPTDKRIFYPIIAPKIEKVLLGDIVVVEVREYPSREKCVYGEIVEVLGRGTSPQVQLEILIREHHLPLDFSALVYQEIKSVSTEVRPAEYRGRRDYRSQFTVTIDGLDAKDFDDAISLSRHPQGCFQLCVHIADVSHYVRPDTALDVEASERGFSAYLVDRVIPMLPEKLSNGICSLNPQIDRLCFTVEMSIDEAGEVKKFSFLPSVIRSDYRLTYEEVDQYFDEGDFKTPELEELLVSLKELSDILEKKRLKRGALEFERPEAKVILNQTGEPVKILVRERTVATKLIEESMILANEVVASFLSRQNWPSIYRIHEKPDFKDLKEVEGVLKELSYPIGKLEKIDSRTFQKVLKLAHQRPERYFVNTLLLRAMKQARYVASPLPHFGLASSCYTHFTSPIRRYPDLIVHRILKGALLKKQLEKREIKVKKRHLTAISEKLSVREREIEEAERESVELKVCEYLLKNHLGEEFEGIVSGVISTGFFVELPNTAEGFVNAGGLGDEVFCFEEKRHLLRGERSGEVYKLGDKVRVRVNEVKVGEKRIEMTCLEKPP